MDATSIYGVAMNFRALYVHYERDCSRCELNQGKCGTRTALGANGDDACSNVADLPVALTTE